LLERCSVFAGGFDLHSAHAVGGLGEDEFATLDLLDALVRKSLLVADKSSTLHTRFTMLETIRQFAEDELVARGSADEMRGAHSRYFADREAEMLALWDGARQHEAYAWFSSELANLRAAFRTATDQDDLDTAAAIAILAGFLGMWVEIYEPAAWAEELHEAARIADNPRLAELYLIATMCHFSGRLDDGVRFKEASYSLIPKDSDSVVHSITAPLASVFLAAGQPERWAELCREEVTLSPDSRRFARATLAMALTALGQRDDAIAATDGLIDAAEAADNPAALSYALLAYGNALSGVDPVRSLDAARRGLGVAQANGIRANVSLLAMTLCKYEADTGDPTAALDAARLAIRNYHDSGNRSVIGVPLANLACLLHRLGRHAAAATILGYGNTPMTVSTVPGLHAAIAELRRIVGDKSYESLVLRGAEMTMSEMATFTYQEIDDVRTELERSP
ncbi:MAG: ATP-binding protein, partial [Mycobacterium sp.]